MVNLSPEVVHAMIQIIDMCSKQGAFAGGNITVAGQVRAELDAALKQVAVEPEAKIKASEK